MFSGKSLFIQVLLLYAKFYDLSLMRQALVDLDWAKGLVYFELLWRLLQLHLLSQFQINYFYLSWTGRTY